MVAALTRLFGVHNLALAEDVVQDAFCRALEQWQARGVPDNPGAWLMATARNRAIDILRRQKTARSFAPEMGRLLETEWTLAGLVDEAFASHVIRDEQLRMMLSCCHPRLPQEAQLALILNILCGFSAAEIAAVFLTGRAAIEKRIARGKKTLAGARTLFDLGDAELAERLATVRRALYLLFSEGYHGASSEAAGAGRAVPGGTPAHPAAARTSAGGQRYHRRPGRPHVPQRRPLTRAGRPGRRSERSFAAGPLAVGPRAGGGRAGPARALRGRLRGDHLSSRGRHRGGPRRRRFAGRHRLGRDPGAV